MAVIKSRLFKSSVLFSWVLSYMVLLIASMAVTWAVYFISARSLETNINSSNGALLDQMQQTTDGLLNEVESLAQQIALNSNVNLVLCSKDVNDPYIKYINTKILNDFKANHVTNRWLDEFYLYSRNQNLVFNSNSVYDVETFHSMLKYPKELDLQQWLDLMNKKHTRELVPVENVEDGGDTGQAIAYMQSAPIVGDNTGTIVILIDANYIHSIIKNIGWAQGSNIFMLDQNNTILASNFEFALPEQLEYDKLLESKGFDKKTVDGRQVIVSYRTSGMLPVKYVSVIPVESYMGELIAVKRITLAVALFCLVLGSVAAYFFSNRNYIHVSELVGILKGSSRDSDGGADGKNEFFFIKRAVANTLDEKKLITRKLEQQTNLLRKDFLARLVRGKVGSRISIDDALASYDITFVSDIFLVMLLRIEDTSPFFNGAEGVNMADELLLAQFTVINIFEELIGQKHRGYMVETDDMLCCLVNFSGEADEASRNELMDIIREAAQLIKNKFGLYLTISVSGVHRTVIGITEAYQEAMEAMEYKIIYGKGGIICYNDISQGNYSYYYPLEVERQLINQIKTGDLKAAVALLNSLFEHNFSGSPVSLQTAKCLMFNLVSTMMKALNEMDIDDRFIQEVHPVDTLLECQTIHEMKERIMVILTSFCQYIEDRKQSHNSELNIRIRQHILGNYRDMNMSMTSIAGAFGMNPMYISRFFKEQNGESVADFINRVRLDNAKQLLKGSRMSVEEVASCTGYANIVSFIRVFKKYEGVTPGKYREMGG